MMPPRPRPPAARAGRDSPPAQLPGIQARSSRSFSKVLVAAEPPGTTPASSPQAVRGRPGCLRAPRPAGSRGAPAARSPGPRPVRVVLERLDPGQGNPLRAVGAHVERGEPKPSLPRSGKLEEGGGPIVGRSRLQTSDLVAAEDGPDAVTP